MHIRLAPYMMDGQLKTTDIPPDLLEEVKILLSMEQVGVETKIRFNHTVGLCDFALPLIFIRVSLEFSAVMSCIQVKKLGRLEVIKASVEAFCVKQDEQRAFQLLTAAGKGDAEVGQQGARPSDPCSWLRWM